MTVVKRATHALLTDGCFQPLMEHVIATTGLSYYRNRAGELAEHVARHMTRSAVTNCLSYLRLLQSGPAGDRELDHLIEDLTIGETFFFRHADLFTALEQTILPAAIENNKRHRRLRIWSAGSSIGAEAYTVAILLRRQFSQLIGDWEITIIGTDINRSFLSLASRAQFDDWALRGVSDEIKQQCFARTGRAWTLRPEFKQGVSFAYHNLAKHPFPSLLHDLFAFDVILCRNVMIYFDSSINESIIGGMRRCLVDGGWLLVGHAEHDMEMFREFRTVTFDGATAYQCVDGENGLGAIGSQRTGSGDRLISAADSARTAVVSRSHDHDARTTLRAPKVRSDLCAGSGRAASSPPADTSSPTCLSSTAQRDRRPAELAAIRKMADRGEIEAAEVQCRQLVKTHKLNPTCHLYHALILEQLGEHASSEQALRRAIYLDRDFVLAHYYLGLTLRRVGRHAEAARSLQNARRFLAAQAPGHVMDDSDGLTAAELAELTRMQLDVLES